MIRRFDVVVAICSKNSLGLSSGLGYMLHHSELHDAVWRNRIDFTVATFTSG